ncbi:sigma-70 family RNA polymerase sigma factor [Saccharothrix sp. NPDC042600]|uniref:RNA polymerase sigma factor n=1 Tax=Saccharothrix TaxID=2071 RepID=UPI0033EBF4F6|nr:hypothetical protein GCM10017745_58120 [Saccharothrix mutabilis subsp. capreolus]
MTDATPAGRGQRRDDAWMVDVVRRCQRGEPGSWADAIRLFRPVVVRVARSFGLSFSHVEDVCQNTWIRMVKGIAGVREPRKARSWLITIARREALRYVRDAERHVPVDAGEEFARQVCADPSPEDHAVTRGERDEVRAAVRALSPEHRALVGRLFGDEELSYAEICAELGMARGSIGPTRARIIGKVRRILVDGEVPEPRDADPGGALAMRAGLAVEVRTRLALLGLSAPAVVLAEHHPQWAFIVTSVPVTRPALPFGVRLVSPAGHLHGRWVQRPDAAVTPPTCAQVLAVVRAVLCGTRW